MLKKFIDKYYRSKLDIVINGYINKIDRTIKNDDEDKNDAILQFYKLKFLLLFKEVKDSLDKTILSKNKYKKIIKELTASLISYGYKEFLSNRKILNKTLFEYFLQTSSYRYNSVVKSLLVACKDNERFQTTLLNNLQDKLLVSIASYLTITNGDNIKTTTYELMKNLDNGKYGLWYNWTYYNFNKNKYETIVPPIRMKDIGILDALDSISTDINKLYILCNMFVYRDDIILDNDINNYIRYVLDSYNKMYLEMFVKDPNKHKEYNLEIRFLFKEQYYFNKVLIDKLDN